MPTAGNPRGLLVPARRPTHVRQKDADGCGVACVAMLADVSYEAARRACFPRLDHEGLRSGERQPLDVDARMMIQALWRLGFHARESDTYKDQDAAVIMVYSYYPGKKNAASWVHCVVWDTDEGRLMDPGDDTPYVTSEDQRQQLDLWERSRWRCVVLGGPRRSGA